MDLEIGRLHVDIGEAVEQGKQGPEAGLWLPEEHQRQVRKGASGPLQEAPRPGLTPVHIVHVQQERDTARGQGAQQALDLEWLEAEIVGYRTEPGGAGPGVQELRDLSLLRGKLPGRG